MLDLTSTYGRGILSGIYRFVREHVLQLDVTRGECDERSLLALREGAYDGVIAQITSADIRDFLRARRIPVVNVSNALESMGFPQVVNDDREIGRAAVRFFADLGFFHVAFLGITGHHYSNERQAGFREAAEEYGLVYDHECPTGEGVPQLDYIRRFAARMHALSTPLAVLACNDLRARRLTDACVELGVRVPQELAVLGVDNDEVPCESAVPLLSSIVLSSDTIGYNAAQCIADICAGRKPPARTLVKHRGIMVRESTGSLAIADAEIRAVVEWIREQLRSDIQVNDLVARAHTSRRSFELRFKKATGMSPADLVVRERIALATRLLTNGEKSVKQVSLECGFSEPRQFNKTFKRIMRVAPSVYRTQRRIEGGVASLSQTDASTLRKP